MNTVDRLFTNRLFAGLRALTPWRCLSLSDFAWIGYSWSGCESQAKPFPRKAPRYRWHLGCILLKMPAVPLLTGPTEWDGDYGGKASAPCAETGRDTGVFVRDYPKATVQWDCRKA